MYRSPNGDIELFFTFFEEILEEECIYANRSIILGDFNIHFEYDNPRKDRLMKIAADAGFTQIVYNSTRLTNKSASLIDLIFTNDYNLIEVPRDFPQLSDHMVIGCYIETVSFNNTHEVVRKRNLDADNIDKIILELYGKTWNYNSTDVNVLYENLINNISGAVDKVAPVKKVKVSRASWSSPSLSEVRRERDKAYKKFRITKLPSDWNNYKQKRNKFVQVSRREKSNFFHRQIDQCKGNSKKMWTTLKELIGNKTKKTVNINNIEFENMNKTIEENFNNFYSKSVIDIATSIPPAMPNFNNSYEECSEEFVGFHKLNISELKKIIMNLKNKSTSDNICDVKFLKSTFCAIGYPLLHLVNTSLATGRLPRALKTSVIVPIPKVLAPTKPADYRPINLLSVMDKILETIVCNQLRSYLEKHKFIFKGQSGFRAKHSCETALQYVCSKWRSDIHGGNVILSVFIDLQRAFETIDRNRLIEKLQNYGVKEIALSWFSDYLSDRSHVTRVNGFISQEISSDMGVPQGSVLGPLLFILYINDVDKILRNSFVSLFADDTLVSVSGKNFHQLFNTINSELSILHNWLCVNRLKLNSSKTKYMVFGSKHNCKRFLENNYPICINTEIIEHTNKIKYLGVILDSQLNFSQNIDYICRKIGKKIGFFRRVSQNLSYWSRLLVFNTIVYPHFTYCNSLLVSCSKTDIKRLQVLQNKAMRTILSCSQYTPVRLMLKSLGWLSVSQSIERSNLLIIFKIQHKLLPQYLEQYLIPRCMKYSYNIRSKNNFDIQLSRTTHMQKSLFNDGLRLFNALSPDIKNSPNVRIFQHKLKNMYLNSNLS